uniref:Uncharacterized protein n=1 Tax=Ditylenchus dipsaci TaxID=166011 RepID=A0A915CRG7_9BILA
MGIEQNALMEFVQNALNAVPAPVVQAILPAINQDQPEVEEENDTISFVKSERGKDKAVHRDFSFRSTKQTIRRCTAMNPPGFPVNWWSCYERTLAGEDRTNNYAEAAHRRLQDALGVDHPTVGRLLQDLKESSEITTLITNNILLVKMLRRSAVSTWMPTEESWQRSIFTKGQI